MKKIAMASVLFSFGSQAFCLVQAKPAPPMVGVMNENLDTKVGPPPSNVPEYRELIEFQAKQNEQILEAQRRMAETAIEASTQSQENIGIVVGLAAVLVTVFTGIFGWAVQRLVKKLDKGAAEAAVRLEDTKKAIENQAEGIAGMINDISVLRNDTNGLKTELGALESARAKVEDIADALTGREIQIKELAVRIRLVQLGVDLQSGNDEERLRSTQAVSEILGQKGEEIGVGRGSAIRLLLDCLRKESQAPVLQEALYGLQHCADVLADDGEAIDLMIRASRSTNDLVRIQAVETMCKVGGKVDRIIERLRECAETDENIEIRAAGKRFLRERNR